MRHIFGIKTYFTITDDRHRLHGLDHLRAAAIAMVVLFHYDYYYGVPEWLAYASRFGWSGVDLFFVLSGYLIADKLYRGIEADGKIDFNGFYLNRFLRIIPAYLAVVVLYFTFPDLYEGRGLQPIWKFLTFTQNISIDMHKNTFSHAWSLCVEEHFYLFFPMLIYLTFSIRRPNMAVFLFVLVAVSGIIIRYVIWDMRVAPAYERMRLMIALREIYYPTYTRLDGLLVGVAIASIFNYRPMLRDRLVKAGNLMLALSIMLLGVAYILFDGSLVSQRFTSLTTAVLGFNIISIAYGLLVIAAMSPRCILSQYRIKPVAILATLAYPIYLTHKMINHLVNTQLQALLDLDVHQLFPISLAGVTICGYALHLSVEKPFLILRDKLNRAKCNMSGNI